MRRLLALLSLCLGLCVCPGLPVWAGGGPLGLAAPEPRPPTADEAAALFATVPPVQITRDAGGVPGWSVRQGAVLLGHVGSTWELAGSVGYSGRPLDVLVAVTPEARIAGALLVQHNEPVLTLGISDADIAAYVSGFAGHELTRDPADQARGLPDVISRATVSTGVIRDGILRSARTLAIARGLMAGGGGIDRIAYAPADWAGLLAMGALAETRVSMDEAAKALAGAKVPLTPGAGDFLQAWAGVIDPPTVGQNLLGQQGFTKAVGTLPPGGAVLIVMTRGVGSHRGTDWQSSGIFDRLTVVQGENRWQPTAERYQLVKKLSLPDAPEMKEISLFALPPEIDAARPFALEIRSARAAAASGEVSFVTVLPIAVPAGFLVPQAADEPLWRGIWTAKTPQIALVALLLTVLTLILFAQEWITRRPRLWRTGRLMFLASTFLILGMGLNGQLSVVQVMAFVHSLLTGFRWETFLIEPVIFILWSFTALGMLFWGRGVYCGWLCPFGALQELTNAAAVALGIRQIAVPQALHERLWVIKYSLFMAILALSFYSMHDAILLAEVEPFKTAISLRFVRAWPFLLFVAVLLGAGMFIERFYCRYLCPLGAGLALPAKLKVFDWLKRRPQCGRECRMCETKCTVGAIDAIGRINANECVLCLRCQVIMNDATQCPVLKRRARSEGAA
ncbi:NosR/NirI family protein [Tabrizicola oligotrophica]|uniref:4Fe-4S binding protein n=1 Tax=Tabrizicola oligotrophica TaxID=2710650 RepID=A0A6M0QVD7_9RHOB|nr:NosR/NirI family protein [Tabrizicola oligotrophica]NEY91390.1 4Fe-4S binding protein [Tabrizicola oligotrophica]